MIPDHRQIQAEVAAALAEDLGPGDASAELIDREQLSVAWLLCRDPGVIAGQAWANAAFHHLDPACRVDWQVSEGQATSAGQRLARIEGCSHALLSAERTALNFLQLLSGVATTTRRYVEAVSDWPCRILDTRKTLPGLRLAQKYAVRVGGGHNHRLGLHDLIMLKENHLAAAGGIGQAVAAARKRWPTLMVEVETETLDQVEQAITAGADRIMLDNFSLEAMREAVKRVDGRAVLEASGGVELDHIQSIAATGVNEISVGNLTKAVQPLDLSLRFATA